MRTFIVTRKVPNTDRVMRLTIIAVNAAAACAMADKAVHNGSRKRSAPLTQRVPQFA